VQLLKIYFDTEVEVIQNKSKMVDIEFVSNAIEVPSFKKILHRSYAHFNEQEMETYYKKFRLGFRDRYKSRAKKRIWFTGENLRAPSGIFDATFSFDSTDSETSNVFFPYWYYRINWFGGTNRYEIEERIETLLLPRKPFRRDLRVLTFSSEYEILRLKIVNAVKDVLPVDCYGKLYRNFVKSKYALSLDYGLQICNENDLYPNYVTEKLQESWVSRNVPIWAGIDRYGFFNQDAIIDVTGLTSPEITERISKLTAEEMMYRQSQPLLLREPKLDDSIKIFKSLLGSRG